MTLMQAKKLCEPIKQFQCHLHHIKYITVVVVLFSFVPIILKLFISSNTASVQWSSSAPAMTYEDNVTPAEFLRCVMKGNGWLDRLNFDYNNSAYDWTMISTKKKTCRLYPYAARDVVNCIDSIHSSRNSSDHLLHFVFIGDSRARQQFYNFLKFIPEYDRGHEPLRGRSSDAHTDRNVTIPLLGLRISFLWRPELTESWSTDIQNWIHNPPYLIVICIGIHHLKPIKDHEKRLEPLQRMIKEFLIPALQSLANVGTELIWLNQFPMLLDQKLFLFGEWNGAISSENIQKVNDIIRKLLKKSKVNVWDSGNPPAEEYRRSCHHLMQEATGRQPLNDVLYHNSYFNCLDMIHPGYVALYHTMQVLLNHVCNHHMNFKIF